MVENKARPEVPIMLDKERRLRYDFNALASYEEASGRVSLGGVSAKTFGVRDLRALLWACLLHEDRTLTLEQVGSMMNKQNLPEIVKAIEQAARLAEPEGKKANGEAGESSPPFPG